MTEKKSLLLNWYGKKNYVTFDLDNGNQGIQKKKSINTNSLAKRKNKKVNYIRIYIYTS